MTRYRPRRPFALAALTIVAISVQFVAGSSRRDADRVSHRATSHSLDANRPASTAH